jgi:hypothetical protein
MTETVVPLRGEELSGYLAYGEVSISTEEAMSHENLTARGYDLYTVYKVTAPTHRFLSTSQVPTFQKRHESEAWTDIDAADIQEIEYPTGRLILKSALASDYTVRIKVSSPTAKYLTLHVLLGAYDADVTLKKESRKFMLWQDSGKRVVMKAMEWSIAIKRFHMWTQAYLETNLTGDHNDLKWIHWLGGIPGNDVSVTYVDPGAPSQALSISVSGKDITVNLATNGASAITSTAAQIASLANSLQKVKWLNVKVEMKTGNDGSGVVTAMSKTNLANGANPLKYWDLLAEQDLVGIIVYDDETNTFGDAGYCHLSQEDTSKPSDDLIEGPVTFEGNGRLYLT